MEYKTLYQQCKICRGTDYSCKDYTPYQKTPWYCHNYKIIEHHEEQNPTGIEKILTKRLNLKKR